MMSAGVGREACVGRLINLPSYGASCLGRHLCETIARLGCVLAHSYRGRMSSGLEQVVIAR